LNLFGFKFGKMKGLKWHLSRGLINGKFELVHCRLSYPKFWPLFFVFTHFIRSLKVEIFVVSDEISAERYFKIPHLITERDFFFLCFYFIYCIFIIINSLHLVSFILKFFLIYLFPFFYYLCLVPLVTFFFSSFL